MPLRQQRGEALGRAAGQPQGRLAGGQVHDLHVAPEHAGGEPRAERLGASLLGGEAPGVALGAGGPPVAARRSPSVKTRWVKRSPCRSRVRAIRRMSQRSEPIPTIMGAAPRSIADRMSRTAWASPTKIASAISAWPIFSSRICGRAATGPTLPRVSPWPAWISRPRPAPCCGRAPDAASSCAVRAASPARAASQ